MHRRIGWREFVASETGATSPEYAVMLALVTAVIVLAVAALGQAVADIYTDFVNEWTGLA